MRVCKEVENVKFGPNVSNAWLVIFKQLILKNESLWKQKYFLLFEIKIENF